jgi:exo-beta-1,3-glucanase (GH17 family)
MKHLIYIIVTLTILSCTNHTSLVEEKPVSNTTRDSKIIFPTIDATIYQDGVSYGFYRQGQAPGVRGPSKQEIREDLQIISKYWQVIRLYNADSDSEQVLEVIKEDKLPIKVMLGVWLEKERDIKTVKNNNKNTAKAIELANKYQDIIFAVNVGNETQVYWSWHKMESNSLLKHIRIIKRSISQAVTTADDYNFWNKPESKAIANEVDFIVTHIHPLWNGKRLSNAIVWVDSTMKTLQELHPTKHIILGEIGWATNYNRAKVGDGQQGTLIKGRVDLVAQEEFLNKLYAWKYERNIPLFLFEVFDEPWKGGGESSGINEVEKNWGVFYENRAPKESFNSFIKKNNNTFGG